MMPRIRADFKRSRQTIGWSAWLLSKPFDLVTSLLYLGTLAFFLYDRLSNASLEPIRLIQVILGAISILGLLLMGRVEYRIYGDSPPARSAIFLLGVRIVLIELFAQIDSFNFSP